MSALVAGLRCISNSRGSKTAGAIPTVRNAALVAVAQPAASSPLLMLLPGTTSTAEEQAEAQLGGYHRPPQYLRLPGWLAGWWVLLCAPRCSAAPLPPHRRSLRPRPGCSLLLLSSSGRWSSFASFVTVRRAGGKTRRRHPCHVAC